MELIFIALSNVFKAALGLFLIYWTIRMLRKQWIGEENLILILLNGNGCFGRDLVGRSKGRLHSRSIYVRLHSMENAGLITSVTKIEDIGVRGGISRKYYQLA